MKTVRGLPKQFPALAGVCLFAHFQRRTVAAFAGTPFARDTCPGKNRHSSILLRALRRHFSFELYLCPLHARRRSVINGGEWRALTRVAWEGGDARFAEKRRRQ